MIGRGERCRDSRDAETNDMSSAAEISAVPGIDALAKQVDELRARVDRQGDPNALAIVLFSGELDKMLAAFVMATGAAASGMRVSVFCTFWGTAALKRKGRQMPNKTLVERAFGWLLPGGLQRRRLSKLDFGGLGRKLMAREMRNKRVPDVETLIEIAKETGVQLHVCEMSMHLMGIRPEELIDYPGRKTCGVASFLETSSQAGTTLFI